MSTGQNVTPKDVRVSVGAVATVTYEPGDWIVTRPDVRGTGESVEFSVVRQEIRFDGDGRAYCHASGRKRTKTGWHASETSLWLREAEVWDGVRAEVHERLTAALEAMKP